MDIITDSKESYRELKLINKREGNEVEKYIE